MHQTPQIPIEPATGTSFPTSIENPPTDGSGRCLLIARVSRVLQDMAAARPVSDQDLRQHAADCSALMEQAYARFEEHGIPADREEAVLWMFRRDEAHRSLSPAWRAAREAQIQQAIAQGVGFFVTEGDQDHAGLPERAAGV